MSRTEPARNSRIFHDFTPLGVGASPDPGPPPKVGQCEPAGHTEGPFSSSGSRGQAGVGRGGGLPVSRAGGFNRRAKVPPAVGNSCGLGPAGKRRQPAGLRPPDTRGQAILADPRPTSEGALSQRQMGENEACRGTGDQGVARTRAPARQLAPGVQEPTGRVVGRLETETVLARDGD